MSSEKNEFLKLIKISHHEFLFCSHMKIGQKFLCSEVIAPIRSDADDISLYIINFEDLSNPAPTEPLVTRLSKCEYVYICSYNIEK